MKITRINVIHRHRRFTDPNEDVTDFCPLERTKRATPSQNEQYPNPEADLYQATACCALTKTDKPF